MTDKKRGYQTEVLHRSRRPFQRARDAATLSLYGLSFRKKEDGVSRLQKVPEQLELFPEMPSV